MAIDFLIFVLLLISVTVNFLALGAFWVTPALRTTANRFVINLLIVNIVGSLVLAPTLFLSSYYNKNTSLSSQIIADDPLSSVSQNHILERNSIIDSQADDSLNPFRSSYKVANNNNRRNGREGSKLAVIEQDVDIVVNGTQETQSHSECYGTGCETVIIQTDANQDKIVITKFEKNEETSEGGTKRKSSNRKSHRCWSIDLAAALGALSVLLVVGDTWCAVTDPLRYHARISGFKAWLLIAAIWFCGILFGVLSALRDNVFATNEREITEETVEFKDTIHTSNNQLFDEKITTHHYENRLAFLQPNDLYNMIYSSFYFIVIILLPFGFVCGMYWRIFSEARENGLRMRQNGSSPLLQSALNLSAHQSHIHQQNISHIDREQRESSTSSANGLTMKIDETVSPLLDTVPIHKPKLITEDRNQNIVLSLSQTNDEIRRNLSARHLSSLDSSNELDESGSRKNSMRHVHSTPNLQSGPRHHGSFSSNSYHAHHLFHLPSVHVPPKALSYVTSIRHRLSNASSLFKYREESRAARISILVVIMFLISYLPYGLLVLLQNYLSNLNFDFSHFAIVMVLLANLSSPFIFAYRNKRVRRGVKRIFGLDSKTRERHLFRGTGGFFRCGAKASIQVRRSASKASTYSVNSCKYLTPHVVNNGTFLMEIEKCHYLKNNSQRTSIIIDEASLNEDVERRSILKRVCDSSRKLGCASNSCTTSDNEQTDV